VTTLKLREVVVRTYPTACCARWRILGDHGAMQYRITARDGNVGPVRQSIGAAWEAAAALLPNAGIERPMKPQKED